MSKKKGFVVVMAVAIMGVLSAMAGGYSLLIFYKNQISGKYIDGVKAYYMAGSAAKEYMTMISRDYYKERVALDDTTLNPCSLSISGTDWKIAITRENVDDVIRVTSKAERGSAKKTLIMELENNDVIIDKYFNPVPMPDYDFYQDGLPIVKWEVKND